MGVISALLTVLKGSVTEVWLLHRLPGGPTLPSLTTAGLGGGLPPWVFLLVLTLRQLLWVLA